MKRVLWMCLLVGMVALPMAAKAQVSAYGEFTASQLSGGPQGDYLYGGTVGVLVDGPTIKHKVVVSADIQGRFVGKSGERLDGVTIGPRFGLSRTFFTLAPFASFDVGFARYNDGAGNATTDNLFGVTGGVTKRLSPRLDAVVDYKYERFGYNFAFYHPQSFSGGVVYHFVKR